MARGGAGREAGGGGRRPRPERGHHVVVEGAEHKDAAVAEAHEPPGERGQYKMTHMEQSFLGTRPNISESHSEISTRVPFCTRDCSKIAPALASWSSASPGGHTPPPSRSLLPARGVAGAPQPWPWLMVVTHARASRPASGCRLRSSEASQRARHLALPTSYTASEPPRSPTATRRAQGERRSALMSVPAAAADSGAAPPAPRTAFFKNKEHVATLQRRIRPEWLRNNVQGRWPMTAGCQRL